MRHGVRKFVLTAHVALSVAWIGAAAAFLVLSIVGMNSREPDLTRSVYLSANLIGMYAVVPLSLAAAATGLIQSLGTRWGLFRHYWVLAKFGLTLLSIAVLLMHQFGAIAQAARLAGRVDPAALPNAELTSLGFVLVRASALGIVVLIAVTALSFYKPWGLTPYGLRKEGRGAQAEGSRQPLKLTLAFAALLLIVVMVSLHLTGHAFNHGH